jgi:hypothetical protein
VLASRGRTSLGATFIKVAGDYGDRLDQVGGRLYYRRRNGCFLTQGG